MVRVSVLRVKLGFLLSVVIPVIHGSKMALQDLISVGTVISESSGKPILINVFPLLVYFSPKIVR